jgi:hypothetical protein
MPSTWKFRRCFDQWTTLGGNDTYLSFFSPNGFRHSDGRARSMARSARKAKPSASSLMAALAEDDPPVDLAASLAAQASARESPVATADAPAEERLDAVRAIANLADASEVERPNAARALAQAAESLHEILTHEHGVDGREVLGVMVASLRVRALSVLRGAFFRRPFSSRLPNTSSRPF